MKTIKGKYEYFEHTADIKFRAYGNNLEEVFSNSAIAMSASLIDPKIVKKIITRKIIVEASKLERLMYDFLEEFIFLTDTESFILSEISSLKIDKKITNSTNNNDSDDNNTKDKTTKFILTAEVIGDKAKKYDFSGDIKSITYHEMFIKQEKGKFIAQVVVDV